MSTKENTAIARRVDDVARELAVLEPLRISTVLEVYDRGPEPRCATVREVVEAAAERPRPRLVDRIADLDCLIDSETGVHVLRHEVGDEDFDAVASGVRHVEVRIPCHPAQVALILARLGASEDELIVALLHDVIEDTSVTIEQLRSEGFPEEILRALTALTKLSGESRIEAAKRASLDPIARIVKLADNAENMDLSRIPNPTNSDFQRLEEYKAVRALLLATGEA